MPIKRRRNAPHAAVAIAQFRLFFFSVFDEAVRRIGHNRMDGAFLRLDQIKEAVAFVQFRFAYGNEINVGVTVQTFFLSRYLPRPVRSNVLGTFKFRYDLTDEAETWPIFS